MPVGLPAVPCGVRQRNADVSESSRGCIAKLQGACTAAGGGRLKAKKQLRATPMAGGVEDIEKDIVKLEAGEEERDSNFPPSRF